MSKQRKKSRKVIIPNQSDVKGNNLDGAHVNRQYKDRLFKFLFGSEERKENTLALYNAINGTEYTNVDDLTITTLDDFIYIDMKNDVSFLVADEMDLMEQQSTWNPNMPLRGLIYFGRLYKAYAKTRNLDIYGRARISLPTPKYVVLYNGREHRKEEEIRLSDLYEGTGNVEVIAKVININYEDGKAILEHCKILGEYSKFVATMRTNMDAGMSAEEAASATVDKCIEEGILRDILIKHKAEVTGMLFTEFDQEQYDNNRRKEGYEDGHKDGEKKGREEGREEGIALTKKEIAKKMKAKGMSNTEICELTGLSKEQVEAM